MHIHAHVNAYIELMCPCTPRELMCPCTPRAWSAPLLGVPNPSGAHTPVARARACARVCVCTRVRARARVCACLCAHASYEQRVRLRGEASLYFSAAPRVARILSASALPIINGGGEDNRFWGGGGGGGGKRVLGLRGQKNENGYAGFTCSRVALDLVGFATPKNLYTNSVK
jgi:hypothetical protein